MTLSTAWVLIILMSTGEMHAVVPQYDTWDQCLLAGERVMQRPPAYIHSCRPIRH
jgi:hypothetical protein